MSATNLVLSGGISHPFAATSRAVAAILEEVGFESTVREDIEAALRELETTPVDLLTLNLLRWRMLADRFEEQRAEWGLELSNACRDAIAGHLERGGGILALHGAAISFDDWPEWRSVLGGVWRWSRSSHPPLGAATVAVRDRTHPLVAGIEDFEVVDEIYGFLDYEPDIEPLVTSAHGGADHPLLWAREVGGGRVVYDALGHDDRSFAAPEHREIIRRSALWATETLA